jgi:flagellum-specific peptidoglycan hydrolase FlgJ
MCPDSRPYNKTEKMDAQHFKNDDRHLRAKGLKRTMESWSRNWFKWVLSITVAVAFARKDIALSISLDPVPKTEKIPIRQTIAEYVPISLGQEPPMNVSMISSEKRDKQPAAASEPVREPRDDMEKRKKQENYILLYAQLAQAEMRRHGIPASITLAQGLLETNAGASPLATEANNHFGIKCFSKTCRRGHCRNFEDDSHKDFFRIYASPGESYQARSTLLQGPRYQPLFKLSRRDYAAWAKGLKKAGYATDPGYADKLIRIIEDFRLFKYDI